MIQALALVVIFWPFTVWSAFAYGRRNTTRRPAVRSGLICITCKRGIG